MNHAELAEVRGDVAPYIWVHFYPNPGHSVKRRKNAMSHEHIKYGWNVVNALLS